MSDIESAAALLTEAGWTVLPPVDPKAAIPEARTGQVWTSPKPRVEPRTVTKFGSGRSYPWAGNRCVYFTTPSGRETYLNPEAWTAWVRKSGARPA